MILSRCPTEFQRGKAGTINRSRLDRWIDADISVNLEAQAYAAFIVKTPDLVVI
jgi:hypothetical protein